MKREKLILIIAIAAISICLIIVAYFLLTYSKPCTTQECFNQNIANCKRNIYIKETADTITQYKINGKSGNFCETAVTLLQFKKGTLELAPLEGQKMTCLTPLGTVVQPEENLKDCHGILKEEIQNIIIKRMHSQIVQNIGQISEETTKLI